MKKQELKNYVVNSMAHNTFDPNELLDLIDLLPDELQPNENKVDITNELSQNDLKTIESWAILKAEKFSQEWTEDDELIYRHIFGDSLMLFPEETIDSDYGPEEEIDSYENN
ncbi:hypothetical protein NGG16_03120 [Enterococcus casseliflavus]|uniref:hypothetical protein n=1 Tax=Enterococcus casseliflavus TaxID=37734 RepID=UPI002DB7BC5E|nr:hypothetical protein [Enterococcus casseliflavus]MEB8416426.1 hypothetical protein [Enterococcus casseliflavus]